MAVARYGGVAMRCVRTYSFMDYAVFGQKLATQKGEYSK